MGRGKSTGSRLSLRINLHPTAHASCPESPCAAVKNLITNVQQWHRRVSLRVQSANKRLDRLVCSSAKLADRAARKDGASSRSCCGGKAQARAPDGTNETRSAYQLGLGRRTDWTGDFISRGSRLSDG
ncbi:hypothetical protein L1887_62532 [Cichorium endivia]|nr:hypothetical protein L1887_62532 [Cichorium endivia]